MIGMRISSTVVVADNKFAWLQFLVTELPLIRPSAREMAHPDIPAADRKHGRSKSSQSDRSLLAVLDFRPSLNHIHITICAIF